ncbi:hypothetical protein Vretimale_11231 [Volvox reticuliferus]|uniref:MaoC-like domain-containing protein n=1 Tax=Volvox reticuliferus TaxID=1737510 RepID=A0A8J4CQZ3_9CHLO|nr:hypothetical protein Vretifemale_12222 [Volvox reticuliferus]GIM07026.1 hypothetical protein Vretimale_11231 [Volvox reticuliferus]
MDDAIGDSDGRIDIHSLKSRRLGTYTHTYTQRDAMLYALSLGCTAASGLRYVYEGAEDFAVLPTYSIVAAHPSLQLVPLESYIPGGFDRAAALHGEHYLELLGPPLPPGGGRLVTRPQLVDMQSKGNGLVVVLRTVTTDADSGHDLAINEFTTFILGKGGVRTPWAPAPRSPAAVAANNPPNRPPDASASFTTSPDQAALYRLSGDYNPLHIDPRVSRRVGFPQPILHGLCTLGLSVRLVLRLLGGDDPRRLRSVKVRFSKHVLPGETLRVEMWAEQPPTLPTGTHHLKQQQQQQQQQQRLRQGRQQEVQHEQQQEHKEEGLVDGGGNAAAGATSPGSAAAAPGGNGSVKVVFRTWVVERNVLAISNAAVELQPPFTSTTAVATASTQELPLPPPPAVAVRAAIAPVARL